MDIIFSTFFSLAKLVLNNRILHGFSIERFSVSFLLEIQISMLKRDEDFIEGDPHFSAKRVSRVANGEKKIKMLEFAPEVLTLVGLLILSRQRCESTLNSKTRSFEGQNWPLDLLFAFFCITCTASSFFGGKGAKALSTSQKIGKIFGLTIGGAVGCIVLQHCFQRLSFLGLLCFLMLFSTNIHLGGLPPSADHSEIP